MATPTELIDHVQGQLEAIHDRKGPYRAREFLLDRRLLARLGREARAPEELVVVEGEGALDLGLYLAPELFQALRRVHPSGVSGASLATERLSEFAPVVEGISHFLYLSEAATNERPLTQLELEVQGELDKFAAAALHLWGRGLRRSIRELCDRLFRRVAYLPHLDRDERWRYRTANELAGGCARHLCNRAVANGRLDEFLRELRAVYRLWS
ncbi:MAG: hypothetical protein ACYCWW_02775, partial [Deltaproteobacteria bacterium]